MTTTPARWGIIGLGNIAHTLAEAIQRADNGVLQAVGSRSAEKAAAFAQKHGARTAHEGYQRLLDDPDVDVVYNALPNHLHLEWTVKAAQAGKHILCEKPFAVTADEAEQMIAAARDAGVFLMEAFMYRCAHPATQRLVQIVRSGEIGQLRMIRLGYCFNIGPEYENIRLSNAVAGGALMDVGCYTISLARLLAGAEPVEMSAVAHIGDRSRVDEMFAGVLKFPDGLVAALTAATQVAADRRAEIYGSEGHILVDTVYHPPAEGHTIQIDISGEQRTEAINTGKPPAQVQVEHVGRHLDRQESAGMDWQDTLANQRVLDALRKDIGLVFDCER